MKKIELGMIYGLILVIICFQVMLFVQNKKIIGFCRSLKEPECMEEEILLTDEVNDKEKNDTNADDKKQNLVLKDSAGILSKNEKIIEFENCLKDNSEKFQELKEQNYAFEKKLNELNENYKSILEELKNQSLDVTAKDSAIERMKTDAAKYYSEKKYSECTKLCRDVLSYENDNLKIRLLKFKSLYYANPADSSRFDELLKDFSILEKNNVSDSECLYIAEIIKSEKGISDE